jgi:Zn-dependent M28 family amino/carboxypeptidase
VKFHAGEELGLLGSEYNAEIAPLVPNDRIVANINIDMIGRSKPLGDDDPANKQMTAPGTIYAIGLERTSRELRRIHDAVNDETVDLNLDDALNDHAHPDQIFFRSDHWNYGKQGVPFVFYFDGVGAHYHQPTDTVDKIDWEKLQRVTPGACHRLAPGQYAHALDVRPEEDPVVGMTR